MPQMNGTIKSTVLRTVNIRLITIILKVTFVHSPSAPKIGWSHWSLWELLPVLISIVWLRQRKGMDV